ncbi:MAG: DUF938 domain-containing protein [Steroidobacteraceae bacterium]|nr:DUF938 domain-containing protein [Nevskiaceae bacterium]MCP5338960.1 DUF938 domain-containing protein [Nevskiaceae bacterium]MCP5359627.1 DUF938 domain-containing protein [Nevskiaceae bacterium]MCP5472579.1 DUF938 domain-containing protein [Nevskiaceae bacterium]
MNTPELPFSAACARNREPIIAVLRDTFGDRHEVLEIGSGTGQHAVYFAASLPWLHWQPTDRAAALPGLRARCALEGSSNLFEPLELDVARDAWPLARLGLEGRWDTAFSANTLHIMSRSEVERCFAGFGQRLAAGAKLAIYGPFRYGGRYTSDSNARFDEALQARDPASGIRDAEWIDALAVDQDLELIADHDMPANNQLRIWRRRS